MRPEKYRKVLATVSVLPNYQRRAVDALMLRRDTYSVDFARVVVDSDYGVEAVDREYVPNDEARAAELSHGEEPHGPPPDMVFGTPESQIPSALAAVNFAHKVATAAGYRATRILGAKATVATYKNYLRMGLNGFGSIGHGFPGGIVLADGILDSTWIGGLSSSALSPEVIYLNSCRVFNAPLQPAIMKAGSRTFIGGVPRLLIGTSEKVFQCFWKSVVGMAAAPMGNTLASCEARHYPTPRAHGISGDLGVL